MRGACSSNRAPSASTSTTPWARTRRCAMRSRPPRRTRAPWLGSTAARVRATRTGRRVARCDAAHSGRRRHQGYSRGRCAAAKTAILRNEPEWPRRRRASEGGRSSDAEGPGGKAPRRVGGFGRGGVLHRAATAKPDAPGLDREGAIRLVRGDPRLPPDPLRLARRAGAARHRRALPRRRAHRKLPLPAPPRLPPCPSASRSMAKTTPPFTGRASAGRPGKAPGSGGSG